MKREALPCWTITRSADGSRLWTSPTGRRYPVPPPWRPPPLVEPHEITDPPGCPDHDHVENAGGAGGGDAWAQLQVRPARAGRPTACALLVDDRDPVAQADEPTPF